MTRVRLVGVMVTLALICGITTAADNSDDGVQIRSVQTEQQDAWNRHDAKAYANLFAVDGEVINVVGWWWKGRAEIEQKLTAAFAYVFRDSTLTVEGVETRLLTPQIAVAHVRWSMSGAHTPPHIPEPRHGIEIQVLQKRFGRWWIVSFQNTNSVPETPFPLPPPTPKAD